MKKSILVFALIFISVSLYAETKQETDKASADLALALSKLNSKRSDYKDKNFSFSGPSFGTSTEGAYTASDRKKEIAVQELKNKTVKPTTKQPRK